MINIKFTYSEIRAAKINIKRIIHLNRIRQITHIENSRSSYTSRSPKLYSIYEAPTANSCDIRPVVKAPLIMACDCECLYINDGT